ncbi:MAG: AAA family ATPase [Desulfamplus sp.]|nr:AAA family ATPase [Desulfamplus sp.]
MSNIFKSAIKTVSKQNRDFSDIATLAGMSLAKSGTSLVKGILSKPGIHAYLEYQIQKIVCGLPDSGTHSEIPAVARTADEIVRILKSKRFYPNRIAVDGVPGSGKSTLARALAYRLNMDAICLDHQNLNEKIYFEKAAAIYEHHRLLRTQELDCFDAIIYIDEPVYISMEKVVKRKRGGYLVDILDYKKLKQIGEKAFFSLAGEYIPVTDGFVKLRLKPKKGFKDLEYLQRELLQKGLDGRGLTKEAQFFLCVDGKASKGFSAYINLREYKEELISGLKSGINSTLFQEKTNKRGGQGRYGTYFQNH